MRRELLYEVPQESILGSLLFSIFLCDLFHFVESTVKANYAEDTTPYNANSTQELVINELQEISILFKWFHSNYMKVNSHLLLAEK